MTNRQKLVIKARREGFESLDRLIEPNDRYYPYWMLELTRWFAINHNLLVSIEPVNGGGFYGALMSSEFKEDEMDEETLEEEVVENYDDCVEEMLLLAFDYLRQFKKRRLLYTTT